MKRIKDLLFGVVLVIFIHFIDNDLKEKTMPPNEWTRRCVIALVGAALILIVDFFLIHWRYP